ncbi:DUF6597 domain-containing transcriptional factor [Tunturiibacter gelidiferens]|uniref:DUF6597 domain-containing transcriptional factor n=1 Tax=Tunturiibacter gelidiferens TaxID=3069689 RepID=UPI003D9BB151
MLYLEHNPHPALSPFIKSLWYARDPHAAHRHERVLPTGRAQIVLSLARDYLTDANNPVSPLDHSPPASSSAFTPTTSRSTPSTSPSSSALSSTPAAPPPSSPKTPASSPTARPPSTTSGDAPPSTSATTSAKPPLPNKSSLSSNSPSSPASPSANISAATPSSTTP